MSINTKMSVVNSLLGHLTAENLEKSNPQKLNFFEELQEKRKKTRTRCTTIRDQIKTDDIRTKIESNQLSQFGHVKRTKDDRIVKLVYSAKAHGQGKRPRVRPDGKWKEDKKKKP